MQSLDRLVIESGERHQHRTLRAPPPRTQIPQHQEREWGEGILGEEIKMSRGRGERYIV